MWKGTEPRLTGPVGRLFVLAGILLSIPCPEAQTVYRESFDSGPGKWLTGKNRTSPPGWHRNILGFWGEGVPLKWSAKGGHSGGFAYTEPPWYFDDNHGEFYWLYLIFVAYSNDAGLAGADLRDAEVSFYLRGRDPDLKGSRLFFWIQGPGHEGDSNRNWALTSIPWDRILLDGGWQEVRFKLPNDESRWSFMGHTNGGLARRIRVTQSMASGKGTLDPILARTHVDWGMLLCGIDPNDPPQGKIDLDEFVLAPRRR